MKEDVIVITGASSGIGAACARHLATCYSDLVLIGRNSGRLEEVSHDVTLAGATPYPKVVDLTDYKAVKNLATGIVEQLGKIRAVVHSAGEIRPIGLMGQVTSPDWIAGFRSNAEATFNCVKAFVDYSIMQEVSVFIGITSYADRYITSGESQYSAGKAAMSQILRYAQHELASEKMRVVRFNPGAVSTPMQDFIATAKLAPPEDGPVRSPEDVAKKIANIIAMPIDRLSDQDITL